MKQFVLFFMLLYAVGTTAQVDDMYFVPKKDKKVVNTNANSEMPMVTTQERISATSEGRYIDEDVYNRRGKALEQYGDDGAADAYAYEESDYDVYSDVEVSDEADYTYSTRILRFHSPRMSLLCSPWYWDLVYTGGVDNWLVSDDGIYWDVYPAYNYYTAWYYPAWSWNFSYGWGYHSAYCWNYWHSPLWHGHYHYYPHNWWGGGYHGYAAHNYHYRQDRQPGVANLRTGKAYSLNGGRVDRTHTRNGSLQADGKNRGHNNPVVESAGRENNRNSYVRTGRTVVSRGGQNRPSTSGGRTTVVQNNKNSNRNGVVNSGNTQQHRRTTTRTSTSGSKDREYNRPSSTRTTSRSTNVGRSSTNRSSVSSPSRSSGGGSRSSGGGVSRGGRR